MLATPPPAPAALIDGSGRPLFGAYSGAPATLDWRGLAPAFGRSAAYRLLHRKRWQYVMVADEDVLAAVAIIDLGYLASCFAYALHRGSGRLLADCSALSAPRLGVRVGNAPSIGVDARFRAPMASARFVRQGSRYRVDLRFGSQLRFDLAVGGDGAPPPLCCVCPVEGGSGTVNATLKACALPASGTVSGPGFSFALKDAFASLDHTHGLLGRETSWRWLSASGRCRRSGRLVGLNLVSGFNDGEVNENALWLEGRLHKLGQAHISYDGPPASTVWTACTEDQGVVLRFTPVAARSENRDLGLVASRYVQPIGTLAGTIRNGDGQELVIEGVPAVTEDHAARW
jgi:hypothetical protein